uniref:Uncharacterized protein n=1 Tax=Escherichia coli TaxID=562 RepID=A0A7L8KCG8_ECOLX|nr:hypothetical protein [Escherichia coli]
MPIYIIPALRGFFFSEEPVVPVTASADAPMQFRIQDQGTGLKRDSV